MRCVFDTNTLISALLFKKSLPGQALYFALRQGTILTSIETIAELTEVIYRRKFDKYITFEERDEFLAYFVMRAEIIEVFENRKICRDPKDDKFLNLSFSGSADYLITGDEDLLVLQLYSGVRIINAKDFLKEHS